MQKSLLYKTQFVKETLMIKTKTNLHTQQRKDEMQKKKKKKEKYKKQQEETLISLEKLRDSSRSKLRCKESKKKISLKYLLYGGLRQTETREARPTSGPRAKSRTLHQFLADYFLKQKRPGSGHCTAAR